ncbi:hypothetical protein WI75_08665 [Burkholderia ubonensis]|nr:hypothetical protein WI75_08665 [Burkholderia ubonensis]
MALTTDATYANVKETLKRLHKAEPKIVYIAGWEKIDACHTVPLFALGDHPDVPKPPPMSKQEINRLCRIRTQLNQLANVDRTLELRVRRELERPAFRHPQDIALFGPCQASAATTGIRGRIYIQPMEVDEELEAAA